MMMPFLKDSFRTIDYMDMEEGSKRTGTTLATLKKTTDMDKVSACIRMEEQRKGCGRMTTSKAER